MEIQKINTTISGQSNREIKIGKIYQHYSGKKYKIITIAHDSEDPSLMRVIYQGLYDCPTFGPNPVWDRPYAMFAEMVIINGKEQFRFIEVNDAMFLFKCLNVLGGCFVVWIFMIRDINYHTRYYKLFYRYFADRNAAFITMGESSFDL